MFSNLSMLKNQLIKEKVTVVITINEFRKIKVDLNLYFKTVHT